MASNQVTGMRRQCHYTRLDDGIVFDRGGRLVRIRQSLKRKIGRCCDNSNKLVRRFLVKCGFEFDDKKNGHNIKLGLGLFALTLVTSLEPILLKILSDHARVDIIRDYRYTLAQLIILSHVPLALMSAAWYAWKFSPTTMESCDFPKTWFVLLAFLNTLHMFLVVIPCGSVPAPLTVLMVHAKIPVTEIIAVVATAGAFLMEYWFPVLPEISEPEPGTMEAMLNEQYGHNVDEFGRMLGRRRWESSRGSSLRLSLRRGGNAALRWCSKQPASIISVILILAGCALGILPVLRRSRKELGANSFCYFFFEECQSSTLAFLLASVPGSLSSVILERALVSYSLPVSPLLLHAWLVPIQFFFGILLAPVGRHLQHPQREFHNVTAELIGFGQEVQAGLKCILLGEETGMYDPDLYDPTWCRPLLPLLILFVATSFAFHMLTLFVMKLGTEFSLRICTSLAVPLAWMSLAYYAAKFPPHVKNIVPTQAVVSIVSELAMLGVSVGVLLHTTVREPETSYILTSPFEERDRRNIEAAAEGHRRTLRSMRGSQDENEFAAAPSPPHPSSSHAFDEDI